MSGTYLANCLREIGCRVRPDVRLELLKLASQVQRLETALDEMVGHARIEACAIPLVARPIPRAARTIPHAARTETGS